MRTLVIVPTHNEAENIGALLDALNFHVGDADVLVIDDASNDDTRSIVRGRLDAHDGYLQLVERDEKRVTVMRTAPARMQCKMCGGFSS